jgi:hypothetical protein
MPRNIDDRLAKLNARRKGIDRLERVAAAAQQDVLQKSVINESYQTRAAAQPHTRYALGAMQEVGPDYTRISVETAVRVGKQLQTNLDIPVVLLLQGSVPLNVHIRAVSDVDLLAIDNRILTYDRTGCRANSYGTTHLTSLGALRELRGDAEVVLTNAYPQATVDCSGAKCIALSGGSLARPVDVVPAHWNDNVTYQASQQQHDRGVTILNKKVPDTLGNLPFLHIKRVDDRDIVCLGSLKKAIRLAKSVKNDADDDRASLLPSFDIAALMWHADEGALKLGRYYELAILAETQRFFDWCCRNKSEAALLRTPDGTRVILDSDAKFEGLLAISLELDSLAKDVAREQSAQLRYLDPSWDQVGYALKNSLVPAS